MRPEKRKALEAAGWTSGDAADFLAMISVPGKRRAGRAKIDNGGKKPKKAPVRSEVRIELIGSEL